MLTPTYRPGYLLQYCRFPRWCRLGHACSTSLSVIPARHRVGDRRQVLPHYEQVGVAPACLAKANRGRTSTDEGLESQGKGIEGAALHSSRY